MIISKFITSQTGQRLITTHMLPNMSRNKIDNEIPDLFLFFETAL